MELGPSFVPEVVDVHEQNGVARSSSVHVLGYSTLDAVGRAQPPSGAGACAEAARHAATILMTDFSTLSTFDENGDVRVVVETPRGCGAKLAWEPEPQAFVFKRALALGVTYPYDFGFVPSTRADDGDPLDAMVVQDTPTYPGCVIACRLLGVVELTQSGKSGKRRESNPRLVVVPVEDERSPNADELDARIRRELEQFFQTAVLFENKHVEIEGWEGPKRAREILKRAHETYRSPSP